MFTGCIRGIGEVESFTGNHIIIRLPKAADGICPGSSLSVSGVRLTVEEAADGRATAAVTPETRRRTTLDRYCPGQAVNIEPPLAVGDQLGGHLVQGYVDAIGKIAAVDDQGPSRRVWIQPPERFLARVTAKASVAVDGVSLTVAELQRDRFCVVLIPATLKRTTLSSLATGDRVNLEADLISRLVATRPATAAGDLARAVASLGWAGHIQGPAAVDKAVAQLATGGGVVVWDPDREAEGDVIFAGSAIRPQAFTFLLTQCCGHATVPCSPEVLARLEIPPIPGDGDRHGTRPHVPVDLASSPGTGVSAAERAATVRHLADPGARASDFLRPGHVFPLAARPGLLAERPGHTESTIALCLAAGLPPVGVCCEVMGPDGTMSGPAELEASALRWGLPLIDVADLRAWL
jgi:3,4-dihydroxy 2-butanone 4-phosphate synthase